ncbi:hypothetical protein EV702DRAFT_1191584 [Suillus placidus]|uniref:Uncharacterized protein n=1 Tax=Suillus placidus TaxID=48579 RepID=A0A9P7A6S5_9AGAM|nr:hypothetical protein EV702DRAFT_1191584 [Suillus placidus]
MKPKGTPEHDDRLLEYLAGLQVEHLEKDLDDEREWNKDDITHLELLEKHYKEHEMAYEEVIAAARKQQRIKQHAKSSP